jgi:ABC-type Zn uptake system ZnuABC Zn-binding protein ZnuA
MQKKIIFLLIFLVFIIAIMIILRIPSGQVIPEESDRIQIVTTIYPYEILIREIAGERAEVSSLIPADASPHSYSPTPSDIKALEDADLVVSNGMGLAANISEVLKSLGSRHIEAAAFLSGFLPAEDKHNHDDQSKLPGHHHSHDHGSVNPHFWLDPVFLLKIAEGVTEKIISLDPEHTSYYESNFQEIESALLDLDRNIAAERKELGELSIINFHDAFYYFNKRYDIHRAVVVMESPGKEPSPRELVNIGRMIKEHEVAVLFIEPQFNPKAAEVIAEEYGLPVAVLDPLGSHFQVKTAAGLIQQNWNTIKEYF